jgi:hypothetical protein
MVRSRKVSLGGAALGMGKKKANGDIGKLVDAQAKGKNVKAARKEVKRSGSGELDDRQSKAQVDFGKKVY